MTYGDVLRDRQSVNCQLVMSNRLVPITRNFGWPCRETSQKHRPRASQTRAKGSVQSSIRVNSRLLPNNQIFENIQVSVYQDQVKKLLKNYVLEPPCNIYFIFITLFILKDNIQPNTVEILSVYLSSFLILSKKNKHVYCMVTPLIF